MSRRRRTPRSRAETKRATRAALIAAAIERFGADGLDVSLDAICAHAKLTRGAFYVHFADREALIAAAMQEVLGDFLRSLTAAGGSAGSTDTVADVIRRFFAAAATGTSVLHGGEGLRFFHLLEACHRSEQLADTYRIVMVVARDQLGRLLAADQAAGRARPDLDATALAELFVLVALGLVVRNELALPFELPRLATLALAIVEP